MFPKHYKNNEKNLLDGVVSCLANKVLGKNVPT